MPKEPNAFLRSVQCVCSSCRCGTCGGDGCDKRPGGRTLLCTAAVSCVHITSFSYAHYAGPGCIAGCLEHYCRYTTATMSCAFRSYTHRLHQLLQRHHHSINQSVQCNSQSTM